MRLKCTALSLARATGLGALARKATRRHLRILCYHGVWVLPGAPFGECLFISPEQFAARMERLKRSGLPVLPLGEAVTRLGDETLPDAAVAITIDDGWHSTLTHMVPVLEALDLPATLYATSWYVENRLPVVNVAVDYLRGAAGRTDIDADAVIARIEALPVADRREALRAFGRGLGVGEDWLEQRQFEIMGAAELAEAQLRGLDVQLHTHRHINVSEAVDDLPREVAENRASLRVALGNRAFEHFCYPSGTYHPRAGALLAASGVRSATLTTCGLNPPGSDPYALRRLLDGHRVSDIEFDSYLAGTLDYADSLRRAVSPS